MAGFLGFDEAEFTLDRNFIDLGPSAGRAVAAGIRELDLGWVELLELSGAVGYRAVLELCDSEYAHIDPRNPAVWRPAKSPRPDRASGAGQPPHTPAEHKDSELNPRMTCCLSARPEQEPQEPKGSGPPSKEKAMKTFAIVPAAALSLSLAASAAFAQETEAPATESMATPTAIAAALAPSGLLVGEKPSVTVKYIAVQPADMVTSNIVGAPIYNANDEKVGEVADLVLTEGDSLTGLVASVGGFLGSWRKLCCARSLHGGDQSEGRRLGGLCEHHQGCADLRA